MTPRVTPPTLPRTPKIPGGILRNNNKAGLGPSGPLMNQSTYVLSGLSPLTKVARCHWASPEGRRVLGQAQNSAPPTEYGHGKQTRKATRLTGGPLGLPLCFRISLRKVQSLAPQYSSLAHQNRSQRALATPPAPIKGNYVCLFPFAICKQPAAQTPNVRPPFFYPQTMLKLYIPSLSYTL